MIAWNTREGASRTKHPGAPFPIGKFSVTEKWRFLVCEFKNAEGKTWESITSHMIMTAFCIVDEYGRDWSKTRTE